MTKRKIIRIDEDKCNGCGLCMPNCPEGALQMIEGKARLVSDLFCDGLGACLGHCPQGAITVEEREAEAYDERKVMANIVKQGPGVIKAHLEHLQGHGEKNYFQQAVNFLQEKKIANPLNDAPAAHVHGHAGACPGAQIHDFRRGHVSEEAPSVSARASELRQWPVQIKLVPVLAPYFTDADLLIAADCVSFAYAEFHRDLLKGKILLVGCPKLDDLELYREKINGIIKNNSIRSVTYAHMEVPCCSGLIAVITEAIKGSGKKIPFQEAVISIKGERLK